MHVFLVPRAVANLAQGLRPPQPVGRHQVSPLKATTGIKDERVFPQS